MRRDHHHPAHPMIAGAAGIDRRNRSPVGMAQQYSSAKADGVEQLRQDVERFAMHVVERPRQRRRRRGAVAGTRIHQHPGGGGLSQPVRKISPQRGRSQPFVQHDDGRRVRRRRTDHAVFEIGAADAQGARGCEGGHVVGSLPIRPRCVAAPLFPPPLWGRVREGGEPRAPPLELPPSPTLPHKGERARGS